MRINKLSRTSSTFMLEWVEAKYVCERARLYYVDTHVSVELFRSGILHAQRESRESYGARTRIKHEPASPPLKCLDHYL